MNKHELDYVPYELGEYQIEFTEPVGEVWAKGDRVKVNIIEDKGPDVVVTYCKDTAKPKAKHTLQKSWFRRLR